MESSRPSRLKQMLFILGIIGPGIITASVDNDAGGITTYSVAGAHFGYSMLWTLIPITFLLILVQEMCARMGAVTGKGLADLIRENFGVKITIFIMVCLIVANLFVTVAEFAGIAAAGELFGLDKYILVPFCVLFVLVATIKLNYKSLEKFFLLLTLFYVSYILSGVMSKPDWGMVMKEFLVPSFNLTAPYLIILVGVIGTTITPWMQFYLQSSIVEKGIRVKEYKYSKWDVIIGCVITDVVSFFIIMTCATVLFSHGIRIESAVDAARALQPLAGEYAFILFAVGFFGAALFGAFILPISTAFYVCEALGWESGVNKRFHEAREFYLMLILITVLGASVVLIPDIPLINLMLLSQVINGMALPIILFALIYLVNNKKVMGEYVNGRLMNILTWVGSIILVIVTLLMIATTLFPLLSA
ncbi:MAG: Nramp family divalent metal transporter [Candidatus Altiarchaeota archaeon]|nr:Nramp family divalent metal transporter [Candidatus Altiarchaeota archaeon]